MSSESERAQLAGLNFKTAIEAHLRWRSRLEDYIDGKPGEPLSVETISRDDQCLLGRWIYGSGGQRFNNLDDFQALRVDHAQFHRCAGDVLSCAQDGKREAARDRLHNGQYVFYSERIKLHLARLYVSTGSKPG